MIHDVVMLFFCKRISNSCKYFFCNTTFKVILNKLLIDSVKLLLSLDDIKKAKNKMITARLRTRIIAIIIGLHFYLLL